jgi:prevent-host-death family protein
MIIQGVSKVLKTISAMKARQTLGQIMNEVSIRSDRYIIERNGKPLVAIVPVSFIEEQELKKKEFLNLLDKAQSNSNVSEEEIQGDIKKAIREVRKSK